MACSPDSSRLTERDRWSRERLLAPADGDEDGDAMCARARVCVDMQIHDRDSQNSFRILDQHQVLLLLLLAPALHRRFLARL